ncbi:MAG: TolC family outer membrane protein [Hyphomicrobium sp.]|uniref:TolC family outer membrane protein n=1 Tax=Hyphomicrobium sp. TaxID=82 RepID=UPI0039E220BE
MTLVRRQYLAFAALVATFSVSTEVRAETLLEALKAAYQYNPSLEVVRAQQRAKDEDIAIANAGYRPDVSFSANVGRLGSKVVTPTATGRSTTSPRGYSVDVTQPVFTGFQTRNAVNVAEANDRAGRETLRSTEQQVLLDAVTAYGDVTRDQNLVTLNENNLKFLDAELRAQRDRAAVGEVTKTDVAQSEARRALGQADLDLARANLKSSRAVFQQVIGHFPSHLVEADPNNRIIPRSLRDAVAIGSKENPGVVQALYAEQAARFTVDQTRGQLLPQAQVEASFTDNFDATDSTDPEEIYDEEKSASVVGSATVPLYANGGKVFADIRQAKHNHVAALQKVEIARASVKSEVVQAWSNLQSYRAQAKSDKASISANTTALNGVREEERVGQRTVLDVLNAQQELLQSQVSLETTKRDILIASYTLISNIGRLSVSRLGVATVVYNPEVHYQEVRTQAWGTDITHDDSRSLPTK